MDFLGALIAAHDLFIVGIRSREDVERIKKSVTHEIDHVNGWQCTKMVGGRCKLQGAKKGNREWWVWRNCFCPGKKHVRVPVRFCEKINKDGNPVCADDIEWHTLCPLAALELMWQLQIINQNKRCYRQTCKIIDFWLVWWVNPFVFRSSDPCELNQMSCARRQICFWLPKR
jgi:hypothetical protein